MSTAVRFPVFRVRMGTGVCVSMRDQRCGTNKNSDQRCEKHACLVTVEADAVTHVVQRNSRQHLPRNHPSPFAQ